MTYPARSRSPIIFVFLIMSLVLPAFTGFGVQSAIAKAQDVQVTVASYELIGTISFPTGTQFEGTEVGGLSSIAYDARRDVYYAISDDQGTIDPVRYYTLSIDLSDGQLDDGDITFLDVTTIRDASGAPYVPGSLDPEGLALVHEGSLYFSSEGFANRTPPVDPFINRINRNGRQTRSLEIPEKFLPDGTGAQGVRLNLGFESLNVTPDQRTLVTASEGALAQDGPAANLGQESLARILEYRLSSGRPGSEYVYVVNPVAETPVPADQFRVNGLVELLPLDNAGTMLALERSFSVGAEGGGNTIWLYEIQTQDATDVSGYFSLTQPAINFEPVTKRLILNVEEDLGIEPDNIEGMAFGPALPDGRVPLILMSDNNFAANQTTQFIALALELAEVPAD
ncbi:MAG TPA: esterase-like activity of phytase family protein [Anaerolineales bacterium]|nr:esterase-like activity of phytase family protein [Anaerolineales bacterium]